MTTIKRSPNEESALDIVTDDYAENLLRFGIPKPEEPGKYLFGFVVNSGGHMLSCLSYTLSGMTKPHVLPSGDVWLEVSPPCQDAMFGCWSDTKHGVVSRAANIGAPENEKNTLFRGMNWEGDETFAVRVDGQVECKQIKVGDVTVTAEQLARLLKLLEGA